MSDLSKMGFLVEEFKVPSPAQQLLDRFLIGYPRDGIFRRAQGRRIFLRVADDNKADAGEVARREKDFGLARSAQVTETDAVVMVWAGTGAKANGSLLKETVNAARAGTNCFVHGALANTLAEARQIAALTAERKVKLVAGTPLPVTWRLPDVQVPRGTSLKEALVVVQGPPHTAEFHGLEILLSLVERRQGGESGIRSVQSLRPATFWKHVTPENWTWPLLAAAISRSNHPQGDPVTDGRTQDLVGLGLLPKLAREPRGWLIEHRDGLRSAILILDGAIADYDFAVRTTEGAILSAQIYRPPAPADHQFSALTAVVEDFLRGGQTPWPIERNILEAGLLEVFGGAGANSEEAIETPALAIPYRG